MLQSASEFHPLTSHEDRLPPFLQYFQYRTIKSPEHRENRTWILSSRQNYPLPLLPTSRVDISPSPLLVIQGEKKLNFWVVRKYFGYWSFRHWNREELIFYYVSGTSYIFAKGGQRYAIEILYFFIPGPEFIDHFNIFPKERNRKCECIPFKFYHHGQHSW